MFVEYENEVAEESARVRALLEKLRIDAKVMVFWLASGELNTYELIINGHGNDIDWEIIVNDALRDEEWWDDLQMFRGQFDHLSSSQEMAHLAHIVDSTSGRPGVYNPHEEVGSDWRRPSLTSVGEMPKRPAISVLSKLGVSVGMHTQHLNDNVLQDSDHEDYSGSITESEVDGDEDVTPHYETGLGESSGESSDPAKQPLLSNSKRRGSIDRGPEIPGGPVTKRNRRRKSSRGDPVTPTYGTMSTSQTLLENPEPEVTPRASRSHISHVAGPDTNPYVEEGNVAKPEKRETFLSLGPLEIPDLAPSSPRRARSMSPMRAVRGLTGSGGTNNPSRPGMSRQSSAMRFSSRPVPETTITAEGEDSRISFAQSGSSGLQAERPSVSRQSSYGHGRFSSRPMPETRLHGGEEGSRTISFAEQPIYHSPSAPHSASHSRHHSVQTSRNHSRQSSYSGQGDVSFSIPELLHSYKGGEEQEAGSTYSTQSFSLSFNDLPSRAQHLILNELMRRNSTDTAVLMTTLPIPSEGTSLDEMDTIRYLSDVEILCNELPPTLMVLSNNMTVTVSL